MGDNGIRALQWSDEEVAILLAKHGTISNTDLLSLLHGRTKATLDSKLRELGITKKRFKVTWSELELLKLREIYGKIPLKEVMEIFIPKYECVILAKARELGLTKQIIDYKLDLAGSIPNKQHAYYLGWIASDGNLFSGSRKKKLYNITLQIDCLDEYIINTLYNILGIGNVHHRYREVVKDDGSIHNEHQIRYTICNKSLFNQIKSLGITEKKSHILPWIKLDESLYKDFIRGVFDGDGCVFYRKGKYTRLDGKTVGSWGCCFSSASKQFLDGLQLYLTSNQVIKTGYIQKGNGCYALFMSKYDTIRFGKWLYDDGCLKLNRKYDKFQKAINEIDER